MTAKRNVGDRRIAPVILSGGAGTRLWPLSRRLYPKQLQSLISENSLLQETALRFSDSARFEPPLVVCNDEHRFVIAEQLRLLGLPAQQILLEPVGRNTAPAIAVAAMILAEKDPDAMMLVLPADHVITDQAAFLEAIECAQAAAAQGKLVTFGNAPKSPDTGFGYIRRGATFEDLGGCYAVDQFQEKPDRDTAQRYCADGSYYWNAGIFLFRADRYLEELEQFQPGMAAGCRKAIDGGGEDLEFFRLCQESFAALTNISIDYAVMEHTKHAAVVPVDMGWSDVGSWSRLWEIGSKDHAGNIIEGDVVAQDVANSYLRSAKGLLAVKGLEDVVVVAMDDVILVASQEAVQNIGPMVADLAAAGRPETEALSTVYRPWGHYRTIDLETGFQVKRITVKPGGKLSLQQHAHRAEHWVVAKGTGRVSVDGEELTLVKNQSITIPLGAVHRLENPSKDPLELIEVQTGSYLGEDDIIRLDDIYGRKDNCD